MWIASSLATVKTPTIIALGNFDGLHRGHQKVIEPIASLLALDAPVLAVCGSREEGVSEKPPYATVVTFCPHPQEFFTGKQRLLLTPIVEKAAYLATIGIQQLVLLPFDSALASLTPTEFVEQILIQRLQARRIRVGQDFRFGCQRTGTVMDLQKIAAQQGVPVEITDLYLHEGQRVSSSAIRQALEQGEVEQAKLLLGRPYTLIGEVVTGQQLGRTIGFPTANLKLPPDKFLPRYGVYGVWVASDLWQSPQLGVMNLGYRPTVAGQQLTVEVHLLNWSGDLYGQQLTVSLETFLRPEQRFASLDELKAQIQQDGDQARSKLAIG